MKILICVLIIASFVDILCYRIPNLWIAVGMIAGFILLTKESGWVGMLQTMAQIAIVFAIFYPFYLLKGLGAGDVKLFMLLGCYMKGKTYLHCLFVAMLLAGAWAACKMVLYKESRKRLWYLVGYCRKAVLTGIPDVYEADRTKKENVIRLSVPVLCSVLLLYGGLYS